MNKQLNQNYSGSGQVINRPTLRTRIGAIIFLVVGLSLVFSAGAFAYQYFLQKISPCSQVSSGICYDYVTSQDSDVKKVSLRNLDPNKNYKLVVKKEEAGVEREVGSVDVDIDKLKKTTADSSGSANQTGACLSWQVSSDKSGAKCCGDLQLKTDLWTDPTYFSWTCCKPTECAQDGICVPDDSAFSQWNRECQNGEWISMNLKNCEQIGSMDFYRQQSIKYHNLEIKDTCADNIMLDEYFCQDDKESRASIYCTNGCQNGACNPSDRCIDSDWTATDSDIYTKGHTSLKILGVEFDDYCLTANTLSEGICDVRGGINHKDVPCPFGCRDGACILTY